MARLTAMPSQAIVDSLAGTVDFYYWMGIPCARKWPHYPKRQATGPEKANQDAFAYSQHNWKNVPEYLKEMYRQCTVGTNYTARDIYTACYMNVERYTLALD